MVGNQSQRTADECSHRGAIRCRFRNVWEWRSVSLGRRTARVVTELDSLGQRQLAREIDRVGLAAHVHLPAIAATLAAAPGLLFAAEAAADLRATRPGVHVRN